MENTFFWNFLIRLSYYSWIGETPKKKIWIGFPFPFFVNYFLTSLRALKPASFLNLPWKGCVTYRAVDLVTKLLLGEIHRGFSWALPPFDRIFVVWVCLVTQMLIIHALLCLFWGIIENVNRIQISIRNTNDMWSKQDVKESLKIWPSLTLLRKWYPGL